MRCTCLPELPGLVGANPGEDSGTMRPHAGSNDDDGGDCT